MPSLSKKDILPADGADDPQARALLVGRVFMDDGPRPVVVRDGALHDLSRLAPTMSHLLDLAHVPERVRAHDGPSLLSLDAALEQRRLLAPCDLQAVKAAGVTFADSLIERVIEERAKGDPGAAVALRAELANVFNGALAGLKPGSPESMEAKGVLQRAGLWSQYLEVGIGPDAEIFTKAQPMSAIGCGGDIGIHPKSEWNNPEPEIVLAISSRGAILGAALGNDVNLRDFEGRSALLLSKAKDNNASCAIGPFIRLFDEAFTLEDVRAADIHLRVEGADGFRVEGVNSMRHISRDPAELAAAAIGADHQYPDGLVLFLGTMFVPTKDRLGPGQGFTHKVGDVVTISSPRLGALVNAVTTSDRAPPWTFGTRALMASLAKRGLL